MDIKKKDYEITIDKMESELQSLLAENEQLRKEVEKRNKFIDDLMAEYTNFKSQSINTKLVEALESWKIAYFDKSPDREGKLYACLYETTLAISNESIKEQEGERDKELEEYSIWLRGQRLEGRKFAWRSITEGYFSDDYLVKQFREHQLTKSTPKQKI